MDDRLGTFVPPQLSPHVQRALAEAPTSPYLVVDLDVVHERYSALNAAFPHMAAYYAVKANPMPEVLRLLADRGCRFDVASPEEIDACVRVGVDPRILSFGNTIKKRSAIAYAASLGIDRFAFDSDHELDKLIELAPGALVMCRVLSEGEGAAWPLSRKFGCDDRTAVRLLERAARAGMRLGIAFHVGSQQVEPRAWDPALKATIAMTEELEAHGFTLDLVNLGGGFPGIYRHGAPEISNYASAISRAIEDAYRGRTRPEFILEPGRYLVADAGTLQAEVVTVGRKSLADFLVWVYLDVGIFQGLFEATGEAIQYGITTDRDGEPTQPVVLAGPTCDSADVLYEHAGYELPVSITDGDRVRLHATGAYTATYSSVCFNGFPPLASVAVQSEPAAS